MTPKSAAVLPIICFIIGAAVEAAVRPPCSPEIGASMIESATYRGLSIGNAATKALKFMSLA